jgi:mannose-6-phosphate isomerase-like protein (cupin superfamily)
MQRLEASMRTIGIGLVLLLAVNVAGAQQTASVPRETKTFASAADVAALITRAKNEHKEGQPTLVQTILHVAPYNTNLEYRTGVGPAAVHEKDAEFFYVLDGSGTLMMGGKLTGEKRRNPENLTGTGVDGGTSRAVSKGDIIFVPQGTPHWFSKIDGTLILMSMHVPRTSGE